MKNLIPMLLSYRDSEMPETATSEQPEVFGTSLLPAWLLAPILMSFMACTELSEYDNQQIQSTINDSLLTTTESWDVEMMLTQGGRKRIFIEGTYAINYQTEENKKTQISGPVYVQIYDSTVGVESEAWSKRAVYLEPELHVDLYISVLVETHDNIRLVAEYLRWRHQPDRITSPDFVTISTPHDSISGTGFDGQTDLSDYNSI